MIDTRETKLAVSIALTLGKAAQLELAQDAVARAAAGLGGPERAHTVRGRSRLRALSHSSV
jgi:hypothetical protein